MTQVRLALHGPPCLVRADGSRFALPARTAALLAWLALEGPVQRGVIAGRLWPQGGDGKARANLRQLVARLRRDAGDVLSEASGALALAEAVACEPGTGGELLAGCEFDDAPDIAAWLARRRESHRREHVRHSLERAQSALSGGETQDALRLAEEVLRIDAAIEEAHQVRMEALYLRGDSAAAIGAWDECRLALRQAYGIAPSETTSRLGRQLLAQTASPVVPSRRLPIALQRPASLAGRDALARMLEDAWSRGSSLALLGPGGVGKSRIVQRLVAPAAGSLVVACRSGDVLVSGALMDRLDAAKAAHAVSPPREVVAPESPLRSPVESRQWMAAWLLEWDAAVAAGVRRIVVEDLHHADEASLPVLVELLEHLQSARGVQWIVSARQDEMPEASRALLERICRPGSAVVAEVPPLDRAGVDALLAQPAIAEALAMDRGARTALAHELHARVGGNPAFILEALRHAWTPEGMAWRAGQPLPAWKGLRDAVAARLQRLPDPAMPLAQVAAVAGDDFDAEIAAGALGQPMLSLAAAFAELERAQVFQAGRFAHDLMTDAALGTLPPTMRAPLHKQVARLLEERGAPPARIAHHLKAAGEAARSAPWWERAAVLARDRWRQADAARMHDEARHAYLAAGDRAAAFTNACAAARAWLWVGRTAEALASLAAAEALAIDAAERAMAQARRAAWCLREKRLQELVEIGEGLAHLLEEVPDVLPHDELAYALRGLCISMQHGGPRDRTLQLCEAAQARLRDAPADDAGLLASAYGNALHWLGRPAQARRVLLDVQSRLDASSDPAVRIAVLDGLMRVLHSCGDLPGALAAAATLLPLARLADVGAVYEADVMHVQAAMLAAHGRPAEALARFAEVEQRLATGGHAMRETFLVSWAHAEIGAGRLQSASRRLAGVSRQPGADGFALYDYALWWARARLSQALGDDSTNCMQVLDALPALPEGPQLHRRAALATLRPEPLGQLRELVQELRHAGYAALERMVCCAAARSAAEAGAAADAVEFLERSLELQECVDAWADEPARVWSDAVRTLDALGHVAKSSGLVELACKWLDTRSASWDGDDARRCWRDGNPRHRHLLAMRANDAS